ncbi:S-adenosyl-L-methionine-dependent methyltransferase [Xylariaceae sp. FL0016]|nr:S-adenosyl-L-methionine-dependent methyltransferase [Xylariaceae sp. FL0016]
MADGDIDPQLLLFRRQYLQLFEPDFLAWPPLKLLRSGDAQLWLFRQLFDENRNDKLPPERYQMRILKPLVARIERAIEDPNEDEVSDELVTHLAHLMTKGVPSEFQAMQEKAYVAFTCLPEARGSDESSSSEPRITLLERRNLISGSRTTGFRTWEAALHLGSYLLTSPGAELVCGKNVLELGAGTGFLTILCAKVLGAKHVTTTDGDGGVIESLDENLQLNDLDDGERVMTNTLWWGEELKGTWVEDDCSKAPYDVVIGADITYDKDAIRALVKTLQHLFDMRPKLMAIIAGVVRNAETFQTFQEECSQRNFTVTEVAFEAKPMREQKALFYAAAVPIKILIITNPA